jgi:hypothetical protein
VRDSEEAKPRSRHNENKRLCTGAYFLVGYFTSGHPVLKCRVYRIAGTALASQGIFVMSHSHYQPFAFGLPLARPHNRW